MAEQVKLPVAKPDNLRDPHGGSRKLNLVNCSLSVFLTHTHMHTHQKEINKCNFKNTLVH